MVRITDILDIVAKNIPEVDLSLIDKAYIYTARAHSGQVRLSGEPYLSHPLEVASILAKMKLDPISIASGLLHDVIEDTRTTEKEIEEIFGASVKHIVSGVTKLSKLTFDSSEARAAESFRKMLLAMADDIRVILIKLADRLHNMRTLDFHKSTGKKKKIGKETLDIYAPIALRLGIYWLKTELEDISLKHLDSDSYRHIKKLIKKDKKQRENYIETVKKCIKESLNANNLDCNPKGRYKSIYSIHQKMIKQNIPFESVYDLIAFRIILDNSEDCYNALGCIHGRWKPVPDRFKDYIGMPKPNMYQSLHTTVIGPSGKRIEIQIRTKEMDRVAESGIAAHWSYKEGKTIDEKSTETFKWVQNIIENQKHVKDPDELLETLKIDLFPDDVYVFTPNGDIKSLPKGATPVDFAYSIHSEIGNQCSGCKVNGRIVPLRQHLHNGEMIEIITSKNQNPTKDWLNFVKTAKAKSRIKQWIKNKEHKKSLLLGREMCEKAFSRHKLNFSSLIREEKMNQIVKSFEFNSLDDLIASIGYGKITTKQFLDKINPSYKKSDQKSLLDKFIQKVKNRKKNKNELIIDGHIDMLIRFGKCCRPIPGDSVIGYITQGHGVTIHRTNCINTKNMNSERRITSEWGETTEGNYPVNIVVNSIDRIGLLADVASHISNCGANILDAKTRMENTGDVACFFTITIKSTKHLSRLMSSLKRIKHVTSVGRTS